MKKELFVFKVREVLLCKKRFSGESYDILCFRDLPFEELLQLSDSNKDVFLRNVTEILRQVARKIYICQIHYSLSDQALSMLKTNSKWGVSIQEYADRWYELYFKSSLKGTPKLYVDEEFFSQFETILIKLTNILKRRRFLYNINSYSFLSKSKREQIERISKNLDANFNALIKQYQYIGLYGLLVYMYTMYVQKFSDDGKFVKVLGLVA